MDEARALLEVKGLQAWYGESHILHGVDFSVREGEVVTLLGRNGAGKTTTLKSVMESILAAPGALLKRKMSAPAPPLRRSLSRPPFKLSLPSPPAR